MAKSQKDYLADLLAGDEQDATTQNLSATSSAPAGIERPKSEQTGGSPDGRERNGRVRGTTLLSRETALSRVSSGEVRQVTQLMLDPARVRVWRGNARSYDHLSEENCQELIDALIAEGGQKVPAVVRKITNDPHHDYEVIAGTRRHWSISWLRSHSYPDMKFLAQVADLDDEAAFRLADIENRARKDVSDLERARNYADALESHYGGHMTRMADRLKLSKGWLSKMLKVAAIPDSVIAAFASPADVQLKPAYPLAQALAQKERASAILDAAARISEDQALRRKNGEPPLPAAQVLAQLLAAGLARKATDVLVLDGAHGRAAVTIQASNRQGVTLRLHAGHGLSEDDLAARIRDALSALREQGRGLQR